MFRLQQQPTFSLNVRLRVPGSDAVTVLPLVAKSMSKRALQSWIASAKDRTDAEFLGDVIVGWGPAVVDESDIPVPFTAEAFGKLLDNWPSAARQIYDTYLTEETGAAAKN